MPTAQVLLIGDYHTPQRPSSLSHRGIWGVWGLGFPLGFPCFGEFCKAKIRGGSHVLPSGL